MRNAGLILLLSFFAMSVMAQIDSAHMVKPLNFIMADDMEGMIERREADKYTRMGLFIDMPANYHRLKKQGLIVFTPNSLIEHFVFNKDSTILKGILVETFDLDEYVNDKDTKSMEINAILQAAEKEILTRTYIDQADLVDSPQYKPFRYSERRLKKYNADHGMEFYKPSPYLNFGKYGNYKIARSIILHKKRQGNLQIHYFVKQGAKVDLDKIVNRSNKMFRFVNIEQNSGMNKE